MCVFFSQLAQMIVNCGSLVAVIDYLGASHGNLRLPGIMVLGYVAAHSENLAMAVILSKVFICLCMTATKSRDIPSHLVCRSHWPTQLLMCRVPSCPAGGAPAGPLSV